MARGGPGLRDTRESLDTTSNLVPTADRELALLERGCRNIAGLDEAGRGCIAGPVVAAAVILETRALEREGRLAEIRDSKLLSPEIREELFDVVWRHSLAVGVGVVSARTIDRIGIVPATRAAMQQGIGALRSVPEYLLIDFLTLPAVSVPQEGIVHGDALCFSIAAASIIAKVTRDRLMVELENVYPHYGFAQHKGYYTPQHVAALERLGPCLLHRQSFAPLADRAGGRLASSVGTESA